MNLTVKKRSNSKFREVDTVPTKSGACSSSGISAINNYLNPPKNFVYLPTEPKRWYFKSLSDDPKYKSSYKKIENKVLEIIPKQYGAGMSNDFSLNYFELAPGKAMIITEGSSGEGLAYNRTPIYFCTNYCQTILEFKSNEKSDLTVLGAFENYFAWRFGSSRETLIQSSTLENPIKLGADEATLWDQQ